MTQMLTKVIGCMNIPFTIKVAVSAPFHGMEETFKLTCQQINRDLNDVNNTFSPFKSDSLVTRFANGEDNVLNQSTDFQEVFALSNFAKEDTDGYFYPYFNGKYDPTGLVKGWAIEKVLNQRLLPLLVHPEIIGVSINGGGDIQTAVDSQTDFSWDVGIEDPDRDEYLIGQYSILNGAMATSGVNKRGEHIKRTASNLAQVTIVSNSLTDADIWATAGMAAGTDEFIKMIKCKRLSGVLVDHQLGTINFALGELNHVETP